MSNFTLAVRCDWYVCSLRLKAINYIYSHFMHFQFKPLSDYAESLQLIMFMAFRFWVIEICKSAPSEKRTTSSNPVQYVPLPVHLKRHPQTTSSSLRWRYSSGVNISRMTMSLLLWTLFWRSKTSRTLQRWSPPLSLWSKCRRGLWWK